VLNEPFADVLDLDIGQRVELLGTFAASTEGSSGCGQHWKPGRL
jgi:hypothetical protein